MSKTIRCENLIDVAETLAYWQAMFKSDGVQRFSRELDKPNQQFDKINDQASNSDDKLNPHAKARLERSCNLATTIDKNRAMVPTIIHRLKAMKELQIYLPLFLALLRIVICVWPQSGYLHPDEFFQSTEIVARDQLGSKINPVWEFTTNLPIRCMLIPNILNKLGLRLASAISSKPSAYLLIVGPRLVYTLLSFVVDYCLCLLCKYYSSRGLWYLPVSIIFQTSFITLQCLTRTLSNTSETVIFALLLVVVCKKLRPRFRILFVTPTRTTPVRERVKTSKQLWSSITLGFLVVLGTFNRPTFPCFAFIPCMYWLSETIKTNAGSPKLAFQRAILPTTLAASVTALAISAYDTYYYRGPKVLYETLDSLRLGDLDTLLQLLTTKWVFTPYNFISYNTNSDNLSNYGLHPPYLHFMVNLPLAFNVLAYLFYKKLYLLMCNGVYRLIFSTHRIYAIMLISSLTATILLSFIPHQEFRFLLPLIVPLVYAFAYDIYASNSLFSIWIVVNMVLAAFYGTVHQSGVLRASFALDPIMKSHASSGPSDCLVHVLTVRCYQFPTYQWNIQANDARFEYDSTIAEGSSQTFDRSVDTLLGRLQMRRKRCESPICLYTILPSIYETQYRQILSAKFGKNIAPNIETLSRHVPHFSHEDLNESTETLHKHGVGAWRTAFGLSALRVNLTAITNTTIESKQDK